MATLIMDHGKGDAMAYILRSYQKLLDYKIAETFYAPMLPMLVKTGTVRKEDYIYFPVKQEEKMRFTIAKMPEGGYVVRQNGDGNRFVTDRDLFASTTVEEALKFIKNKMEPKPARGESK